MEIKLIFPPFSARTFHLRRRMSGNLPERLQANRANDLGVWRTTKSIVLAHLHIGILVIRDFLCLFMGLNFLLNFSCGSISLILLSLFSHFRPWRDGHYQLLQCLSVFNYPAFPSFYLMCYIM